MTYMIIEADKAAAEEFAVSVRGYDFQMGDIFLADNVRAVFLEGVKHAKASASPAREEWEKLRASALDKGAWERFSESEDVPERHDYKLFASEGFEAALTLIAEPLLAENKCVAEMQLYEQTRKEEFRKEVFTLKSELEKARGAYAAMKEALERVNIEWRRTRKQFGCVDPEDSTAPIRLLAVDINRALAKLQGEGEKV